ncbi:DUF222 domain-containing protein [Ornithinimicrobium panacihumi]|uniref:HNH endonuclease signature motif containing protein n=1 Tax=Ornithinimicrobium panacihumi TaxID=2008449 RepID=UPI003F8C6795
MKQPGWGGDVPRTTAAELAAGSGLPGARMPGEVLASGLRDAGRGLFRVGVAAGDSVRFQDAEVDEALEAVGRVSAALMRVRLRMACEAAERGLHLESGHSLPDWLALRCPELARPVLLDLARIAAASREKDHEPLVTAVLEGRVELERSGQVHKALQRVRGAMTPEQYADAVTLMTDAASNPMFERADIDKVVNKLLRTVLTERERDERERSKHELRDVHESNLADGSVKRLIWTFGSDEDYERVRAIMMSPLAAPASAEEQEATGEVDSRVPGQRRYDALMTVFERGVAGTKGQPTTPKAKLIVAIDFDILLRMLADADPSLPGAGETMEGATITAAVARRLACDAEIIPMVLGSDSEILDQGRAVRLVTPGQRLALAKRDGGCTIPGCTVPSTWCDAHHVIHWGRGGDSDLSNYALLCPRHHTWVHQHDKTATVTALGVTWHLR